MYISILGRQPSLGIAELERRFGDVTWFSPNTAIFNTSRVDIQSLGGSQKIGQIVAEIPSGDWKKASTKIVQAYSQAWASHEGKITLGISAYGFNVNPRDVQKTGIILKSHLKQSGTSIRLIPNNEAELNTATSHHNKLGLSDNKVELLVVRSPKGKIVVAESIGAQNITAYAKRDQERPKRDAFVGMLPPKLAQIMLNLGLGGTNPLLSSEEAVESQDESRTPRADVVTRKESSEGDGSGLIPSSTIRILDPFCGTGVILQEAALLGYSVYGTDLSEKMIRYSRDNLNWLADTQHISFDWYVHEGDAMETTWQQPIDAVVCESYLGQPFSAPPSPEKLDAVVKNCNHIIGSFLKNIAPQLSSGTPLCIAIPAWRGKDGEFTHLPLIKDLESLGFNEISFKNIRNSELLYYREDQVVARELLVLVKS